MKKVILVLLCVMLITGAGEEQEQSQSERRKILTQGCLIGGAVIILAGIAIGTTWMFDSSDHSISQDIDINCEHPIPVVIVYSPAPAP